jgi:cell division protease FtsH
LDSQNGGYIHNIHNFSATNRPTALDEALTRPGRFDRVITLGLPDIEGRSSIFKVHARNNMVAVDIDWRLLARASTGFSGAEIMNVMNVAAILAVQAEESVISRERIIDAFEKVVIERTNKGVVISGETADEEVVPTLVKRQIAVYLAAKSLIAFITPIFDEVIKISCCPSNQATGQVFFVAKEEQLEFGLSDRSYLESRLVVLLAGRAAENLVFGSNGLNILGEEDMKSAYFLARDMVFKYGFGRRMGPIDLIQDEVDFLRTEETFDQMVGVDPLTAAIGAADIADLLAAAEAKAHYGLAVNYQSMEALSSLLDRKHSIGNREIKKLMEDNNALSLPSPYLAGFSFDSELTSFENATEPMSENAREAIQRIKEKIKSLSDDSSSVKRNTESRSLYNTINHKTS